VALAGLTLRPYQPSDFETLHRIDQACFPRGIAYGRTELRIYLRAEGAHCIIADVGGEVAGFILTEQSGDAAHIITLDVLDPYRRQSVGSRLLEAAEQEAVSRGARRMVLETATTNYPAIALWTKHGYRRTVIIKNYYGHGLDAFEMQKHLERKSQTKAQS
jgi:[ribosomal protein S18]-alanine N-acetyltransferase